MAKKNKFDGIVVKREADAEGFVHAYDKNGRACWSGWLRHRIRRDCTRSERRQQQAQR